MTQKILALFSGIIFGLGLTISSMTNPAKVIGFLDILGTWDPSLGFVMGGAILITAPLLFLLNNKKNLILVSKIELPSKKNIDISLVFGSIIFGLGWGMVGLCPGPAISSIALLNPFSLIFIASLIGGFYLTKIIKQ